MANDNNEDVSMSERFAEWIKKLFEQQEAEQQNYFMELFLRMFSGNSQEQENTQAQQNAQEQENTQAQQNTQEGQEGQVVQATETGSRGAEIAAEPVQDTPTPEKVDITHPVGTRAAVKEEEHEGSMIVGRDPKTNDLVLRDAETGKFRRATEEELKVIEENGLTLGQKFDTLQKDGNASDIAFDTRVDKAVANNKLDVPVKPIPTYSEVKSKVSEECHRNVI